MIGPDEGLDQAAVRERVLRGQVNDVPQAASRTVAQIVWSNLLTPFNALLGTLFVVILLVGAPADALFGVVLIANTTIGIYQELRAKRTLDRLAVLTTPRARPDSFSRSRRATARPDPGSSAESCASPSPPEPWLPRGRLPGTPSPRVRSGRAWSLRRPRRPWSCS
jgi:hypothetical protein